MGNTFERQTIPPVINSLVHLLIQRQTYYIQTISQSYHEIICHRVCTDSQCSFYFFIIFLSIVLYLTGRQMTYTIFTMCPWKWWAFWVLHSTSDSGNMTCRFWAKTSETTETAPDSARCQLQSDKGVTTKGRFKDRTGRMPPWVLSHGKQPLRWGALLVEGFGFDSGSKSDLQIHCCSSAGFQMAVCFLHIL